MSALDGSHERTISPPDGGRWAIGGVGDATPSLSLSAGAAAPDGRRLLGWLGEDHDRNGRPARSTLFALDLADGPASLLLQVDGPAPMSTWSRDGRWVALIEHRRITIIDPDDPNAAPHVLEDLIPDDHHVMTAG